MPSVDNRVVRMEFDNAQFEARIRQTLHSLSQLDKALKMDGASKGLSDVNAAASRINLGPLNTAVQGVSAGFLALSTVAITALATVTRAAITAGSRMASALTLDPIMQGFQEYELNIGSIQTILANTKKDGTNLQQVNAALDQLNDYADQTIYNFAEMTRNIGTFTAAGVELDTSVNSIKGIANLAAISGSNSQQAATAMYQLSQAISTGTLRLMDWNSVVNAGMGGEVFQEALFETAKAFGTIKGVDMGTSFQEWTDAGNSFRDSLQEGWLTADVLTTTLEGIGGNLDEAALKARGFTDEQARALVELGELGIDSATKVRTLTQLIDTIKESIGSGWAQSFRTLFGDFEEATQLFTGLSNSIGGFFDRQSEARNAVLEGWAELGGRGELLQALEQGFFAIGRVLSEVGKAFRDIFPATTAERLFELTQRFSEFTASLRPSEKTIENVRRISTGLFAALDIGWETIKAGVGFIKDLIVQLTGLGSGNYLEGAADILDFFVKLRDRLEGGRKIQEFFDNLASAAQKPIGFLRDLKEAIFDFFGAFGDTAEAAGSEGVDRVSQRFESLRGVFERLGAVGTVLKGILEALATIVSTVGAAITEWFQELGDKIREAIGPDEFNNILDALNVSLLGGLGLIIARFLRGGLSLDLGDGLFSNISGAFEQLTGVLESMQASIRAEALLKIAGAVGILAVSMVALSLIDSGALTRALVAMSVGFAQLMGAFAVLNTMSVGLTSGATFSVVAAGMIAMSAAILVMAGAVAILAQLSWSELAKGLLAVTVILGILTGSAILLSKYSGSIFLASISLIAMSTALGLLAGVVAIFGQMDWGTLAKGFAAVAAGLLIMAGATHLMPPDLAVKGIGLIFIATAMNILAVALKSLAEMSWGEMVKGFAGIAGALVLIGGAMHLFPPHMVAMAAGLVLVGVALNIIARAMSEFGGMSWTEIGKGLITMAGALLILAVAANAMSGALAGAAAILVMSVAIGVLAKVMKEIAGIPFGDILKALGGIALALTVLGIAAFLLQPVVPALLGLGAALILVGGAFALFGAGAYLVARAFEILGKAGPGAADAIVEAMKAIGRGIPAILAGLAEGVLGVIQIFVDAAGPIAEALGVLLVHLLNTIEDILPAAGGVILTLIETILDVVVAAYPQIVEAGLGMLLALLSGLSDNIGPIVDAGVDLIVNFLEGIADAIPQVYGAVAKVIVAFLLGVASFTQTIIDTGVQMLVDFLTGIANNLQKVTDAVGLVIITFIFAVSNLATSIAQAGTDALVDFLSGITDNLVKITNTVGTMIVTFINAVSANAKKVVTAGANAIISFIEGLGRHATRIVAAGVSVIIRFLQGVSSQTIRLARAAADILINFLNELAIVIEEKSPELRAAGARVAGAIVDGITGGMASRAGDVWDSASALAGGIPSTIKAVLDIFSPSKVTHKLGQHVVQGLANGISENAPVRKATSALAKTTANSFRDILSQVAEELSAFEQFSDPTIRPVLDMSGVMATAQGFDLGMNDSIRPGASSFVSAQQIARSPSPAAVASDEAGMRGGVKFEQNIYSPTKLSASDIYRQTRNQITVAKEELDVA